jgi:hypothetical protein
MLSIGGNVGLVASLIAITAQAIKIKTTASKAI